MNTINQKTNNIRSLKDVFNDDPLVFEREICIINSEVSSYLIVPIMESEGRFPIIVLAGQFAYVVMADIIESEVLTYGDSVEVQDVEVTYCVYGWVKELMLRHSSIALSNDALISVSELPSLDENDLIVTNVIGRSCKIKNNTWTLPICYTVNFDMFVFLDEMIRFGTQEGNNLNKSVEIAYKYMGLIESVLCGSGGLLYFEWKSNQQLISKLESKIRKVNGKYESNKSKQKEESVETPKNAETVKEVVVPKTKKYPEVSFLRKTGKPKKSLGKGKNGSK